MRPTLAPRRARHEPLKIGLDLTGREQEVLALIAEGLNSLETIDRLVASRSTIKLHASAILSKLGVTGRTEAETVASKA